MKVQVPEQLVKELIAYLLPHPCGDVMHAVLQLQKSLAEAENQPQETEE